MVQCSRMLQAHGNADAFAMVMLPPFDMFCQTIYSYGIYARRAKM
jgi:hypothetical protein